MVFYLKKQEDAELASMVLISGFRVICQRWWRQVLNVWSGPAARQRLGDNITNWFLPGGGTQIYIPRPLLDDQFNTLIHEVPTPW